MVDKFYISYKILGFYVRLVYENLSQTYYYYSGIFLILFKSFIIQNLVFIDLIILLKPIVTKIQITLEHL